MAHDPRDPQPTPLLKQDIISAPYLDAYNSICFLAMARIREILLFIFLLLVLFLHGIIAIRGKAMLATLPQRGPPPKRPVPPLGPSKQHSSLLSGLLFPSRLVDGSKRPIQSGLNPLQSPPLV